MCWIFSARAKLKEKENRQKKRANHQAKHKRKNKHFVSNTQFHCWAAAIDYDLVNYIARWWFGFSHWLTHAQRHLFTDARWLARSFFVKYLRMNILIKSTATQIYQHQIFDALRKCRIRSIHLNAFRYGLAISIIGNLSHIQHSI